MGVFNPRFTSRGYIRLLVERSSYGLPLDVEHGRLCLLAMAAAAPSSRQREIKVYAYFGLANVIG